MNAPVEVTVVAEPVAPFFKNKEENMRKNTSDFTKHKYHCGMGSWRT